jgi:phasin family protein
METTMLTQDQVIAAQKASLQTLFGLTASSLDAAEKLTALNLEAARALLDEAGDKVQSALSAKDAQSLFALSGEALQPGGDKTAAYGRKVYDIVATLQSEFGKVAEAGVGDAQLKFLALVDSAVKNAPAGSENAASFVKAAVAAANDAFESAQKVAKQAAGAAEANFATLTTAVTKPAAGNGRAKRAA